MNKNQKFLKIQILKIQEYQEEHKAEKTESDLALDWISEFALQFRKDWELQK